MGLVLIVGHLPVTNLKHIGVIPSSRRSVFGKSHLKIQYLHERIVGALDITSSPPTVANWSGPNPRLFLAPLTHGEENRPASFVERISHHRVPHAARSFIIVAVVVFEVVHSKLN